MSDILRQTRLDLRCWWRNGEQLLLMLVIPAFALIFTERVCTQLELDIVSYVDGVMVLSFFATAFTGQAILTAFDRRSNALLVIGAGPLGRTGFIAARMLSVLVTCLVQIAALFGVLTIVGSDHPTFLLHSGIALLGIPTFASMGLLLAGMLRAELVLGFANLLFMLAVFFGGAFNPSAWSPIGAIRHLQAGTSGIWAALSLIAWLAVSAGTAKRTFRWVD